MTPQATRDHRELVKRLFEELADVDAGTARARLAAYDGEPGVAAEVSSLLQWHHKPGTFLDTPAIHAAGVAPEIAPGQALGPWRVVDVIGRGGMGVVYRAERADDAFTRQAAIKVIGYGADAASVVERFRRERQTLADLDHRNIARLFDGGTTPAGQPYLAMEYVDGVPIDRYCDDRRLSIEARLELFTRVCNGVQYAHENLVVHRDIKPDNILVAADDTPKLLDFGIARIVSRDTGAVDDRDTAATWMMTPEFASPEQVAGRAATTATDVYSLGVVLYVLLTGVRPYRLAGTTPAEVAASLADARVEAPSRKVTEGDDAAARAERRGTTPAALARALDGDLDAIVLMALARDPADRYHGVSDLLRDLRAYRTSWPVAARPAAPMYVAGKLVRRHVKAFIAASVVLAVGATGVGAVLWQASVAARERARAERRFDDVRHLVNAFMFDVHDTIARVPGTTATRELIVETAIDYLDRLAEEAAGDASLQRELAQAWMRVGDVQGNPSAANIGDTAGALRSYRRAAELAESARRASDDDLDALRVLAGVHRRMADVLAWSGDLDAALPASEQSKRQFDTVVARTAAPPLDDRLEAAIATVKLGDVLGNPNLPNVGRAADAAATFEAALAEFRALDAQAPGDARVRRFIGLSLERIGTLHEAGARWVEAERAYRESFDIRKALAASEPALRNAQRDLAIAYEKLGKVERAIGGPDAGLDNLRGALALFERLAAADPADVNAARSVAVSREVLGQALAGAARWAEARPMLQEALAGHRALAEKDPGNAQARCDTARLLDFVGDAYGSDGAAMGRACASWRESLSVLDSLRQAGAGACLTGGTGPDGLRAKLRQRCS